MGTLITTSIMIKLLLTSSLLALTAAVGAVAHHPVVKSVVDSPAEVEHEVTAHHVPVALGYHGLGHFGYYGKRSADAEPEADAYYGYYGYGGYGYRGYRGYYGYPGYRYYGKRSADAEPAVLAGGSRVISAPTPLIHNPPALPAVTYAAQPLAYHAGLPLAGHVAYAGLPYAGLPYAGLPLVAAPAAAEEAVVAE